MTITLSIIAKTQLEQTYRALDGILAKAAAHADENGVDEAVYLDWRVAPDMFALARQVQLVTDFSLRGLSRLAGQDPVSLPDEERNFGELRQRLATARDALSALPTEKIDADPAGNITFPAGPGKEMTLPRQSYLQNFVIANSIFHASTAYVILRALGVPLGKADFMGISG
ncbi:MAG: DUF1993 domain-containing protein [Maricaulis sp.]|jgi:hypothetical protein|nr:DUF1993 domain-containing protein [Maricaulis sp.]MDG2045245.1 DUF1993 domain-containing protein [Maricaulis sp.]